jgi:HEAT repeat protein
MLSEYTRDQKQRIRFGVFVAALLAAFAWLVLRQHEPAYQGKPLSICLYEAYFAGPYDTEPARINAANALHALGPQALPVLVRMVAARETIPRFILRDLAREFDSFHLPPQVGKHEMAIWAFNLFGSSARPAVPALIPLLADKDVAVRADAAQCLAAIGPAAEPAVPALMEALKRSTGPAWQDAALRDYAAAALGEIGPPARSAIPYLATLTNEPSAELALRKIKGESIAPFFIRLKDTSDLEQWHRAASLLRNMGTNALPAIPLLLDALDLPDRKPPNTSVGFQERALMILADIHGRPDICLPRIVPLLNSTNFNIRYRSLLALRAFGPAAKPAVPYLLGQLTNSHSWLNHEMTNALRSIDPDAAAQAGIR